MEPEIIKDYSCLTDKQRTAYALREEGLTFQAIADKMGITASAARNHVRNAERRFREHTAYHRIEQRNLEPLPLDLTRGEGKIILSALQLLERDMMKSAVFNVKSDWRGRLPYEAMIASDLYRKLNVALYGEDHKFYDLFVGAFSDDAPADTDPE